MSYGITKMNFAEVESLGAVLKEQNGKISSELDNSCVKLNSIVKSGNVFGAAVTGIGNGISKIQGLRIDLNSTATSLENKIERARSETLQTEQKTESELTSILTENPTLFKTGDSSYTSLNPDLDQSAPEPDFRFDYTDSE